ncbi:hypothetical protein AYK26_05870 [Euryarchaeota archaeon SM23-78]|nr:MAG: hypothetical protein AYK26_05870 [Euryarchaeota archaeon SM23-78]MBW3001015.1 hypothetical protein [Candidatus Woesearchaeota archaeon]
MKKIINGKITIEKPEIDLAIERDNFERLDPACTKNHLGTLAHMLRLLSRVVYEEIPEHGGKNPQFQKYLIRLGDTLDTIVLKNKIESMKLGDELMWQCAIDPTDSGFPIIIRDFYFLKRDKQNAEQELAKLPSNKKLVQDAEFTLFRGVFPRDVIRQKLERNYYEKLLKLDLPESLKTYPENYVKKQNNMHYFKKSIERLDESNNLPRFYTLYFQVTNQSYSKTGWKIELEQKIRDGFSALSTYELRRLAEGIEDIEGIYLQMIERYDVGPFYNNLTHNEDIINTILEDKYETDGILVFRKYSKHRVEEQKKKGFKAFWKGLITGDMYKGSFSPVLQSPKYMLMPHRLVQRVHNLGKNFEGEVKLLGITSAGGSRG